MAEFQENILKNFYFLSTKLSLFHTHTHNFIFHPSFPINFFFKSYRKKQVEEKERNCSEKFELQKCNSFSMFIYDDNDFIIILFVFLQLQSILTLIYNIYRHQFGAWSLLLSLSLSVYQTQLVLLLLNGSPFYGTKQMDYAWKCSVFAKYQR